MSGSSESCWVGCTVISLEVKYCGPVEVPGDLAEAEDSLVEVIQKITNALTRTRREAFVNKSNPHISWWHHTVRLATNQAEPSRLAIENQESNEVPRHVEVSDVITTRDAMFLRMAKPTTRYWPTSRMTR